jgi:tetratricopeptide (TPR) repeat protein
MTEGEERRTRADQSGSGETPPASEPPCYDVFISYSSKDKAWVRGELLKRIEQAGLKAFVDFRDFTRGAPSIKEIERGVKICRKTLLVLTPAYIKSEWCEYENLILQTLGPANRDLRLLPLLKAECDLPVRINYLTYIDATDGADLDLAWQQLLKSLDAPKEPESTAQPTHGQWLLEPPYPMLPNFTGRTDEREMLKNWLHADPGHPLMMLRALGGFGKSALAWHWLIHDVDPSGWPRVVWWSFYDEPVFESFVGQAIDYLRLRVASQLSPHRQVEALLHTLQLSNVLFVLDGFERALRAFGGLNGVYQEDTVSLPMGSERDCLSALTEVFLRGIATLPGVRGKVLMTTRLRPRVLEVQGGALLDGCRDEELTQLRRSDAVDFFRAQGIRGARAEIESACAPYGYHPLSLRLLAGWIVSDLQQPGDITAAKRLDVSGDLVQRQHHVLEQAYDSLMPARKALLGRIACFRGPVKYDALKVLAETPEDSSTTLDADLRDLVARALLHHDTKEGRFDLHPIVRRYAYDRLTAPDRAAAHTRLRDYFAAVPQPDKVTRLEDLAPVIELYHHTVRAGQFDEAFLLFRDRLSQAIYYQLGAYLLQIDLLRALFPDGEDCVPRLQTKRSQSWTANALANSYSLSGEPRHAASLYAISARINESEGDRANLAIDLGNLATQQTVIGALQAAEVNLSRSIRLRQEVKNEFREAGAHQALGWLLAYRGEWANSEGELAIAMKTFDKRGNVEWQGKVWAFRALCELLRLRSTAQSAAGNLQSAIPLAHRALQLADETTRTSFPHERDYIRAHWLLGAAHHMAAEMDSAEYHLHEALERCRRNNTVEAEADILIDLARLRATAGAGDEAQRLAEEALSITERSGYVLQGADAHLELAKLAFARGDKAVGLQHAQKAKELATCDGPPDYTYKVAYDEACALLKGQ